MLPPVAQWEHRRDIVPPGWPGVSYFRSQFRQTVMWLKLISRFVRIIPHDLRNASRKITSDG